MTRGRRATGVVGEAHASYTEFINRVAAPIANKLFECGMIS